VPLHLPAAGALALAGAWAFLFRDALAWLAATFTHEDYRLNLVLALALAAVVARRADGLRRALADGPRLSPAPLALTAICALAWLLVAPGLDIDILSSALFGLGAYGLLGLYLSPSRWWMGLPAALLAVGVLPFGTHLNMYLGFPARAITADWVREVLTMGGVAVGGTETILVVMSQAAHVDLPCSGVRSLWTGGLFFLGATWLTRRRIGLGWLAAGAAFAAALVGANAIRVLAVSCAVLVLQAPKLADVVHAPLGVLGFAAACALALALLRRLPAAAVGGGPFPPRAPHLAPALTLLLLALSALDAPRAAPPPAGPAAIEWSLPAQTDGAPLTPTAAERDLYGRHGRGRIDKWTFADGPIRGAVLVAFTDSWRAHHPPALCLRAAGFDLDEPVSVLSATGFTFRRAAVAEGAAYSDSWFQAAGHSTDDFSARTWSGLTGGERRWALVSVLLETPAPPDDPALTDFYDRLRGQVDAALRGWEQ